MNDTPRTEGEEEEAPGSPSLPAGDLGRRVAGASAWTFGAMTGIHAIRAGAQIVLANLLLPEYWGVIALMRVFLVAVEMLSDVGIRGSIVFHRAGGGRSFLNTAWTLQIGRGVIMWGAACALAWPASRFFEEPLLLWLLPVAGLESINNGLLSVGVFRRQRTLRLGMPIVLEWIGLGSSILASIVWALVDPSVWALAIGPLVGGVIKTTLSHVLIPEVKLRLQWDRGVARDLIDFGKWVYLGTAASFLAQQFPILFLGKILPRAILGVYSVAWNFSVQASKPLTMIANQVMLPVFAEGGRMGGRAHAERLEQAMYRFLPSCLLIVLSVGLVCPAFFGILYPKAFIDGGQMGRFLALVIWFMLLQQLPRTAMLSVGDSRGTCVMMVANAMITIAGTVLGFQLGAHFVEGGALKGAILGNALGNVTGCIVGAWMARASGIAVHRPMIKYSLAFVGLFAAGVTLDALLRSLHELITPSLSSLLTTAVVATPLAFVVWQRTLKVLLAQRRAKAQATAP